MLLRRGALPWRQELPVLRSRACSCNRHCRSRRLRQRCSKGRLRTLPRLLLLESRSAFEGFAGIYVAGPCTLTLHPLLICPSIDLAFYICCQVYGRLYTNGNIPASLVWERLAISKPHYDRSFGLLECIESSNHCAAFVWRQGGMRVVTTFLFAVPPQPAYSGTTSVCLKQSRCEGNNSSIWKASPLVSELSVCVKHPDAQACCSVCSCPLCMLY